VTSESHTITVGESESGEDYTLPVEDVLTGRTFVTGKSGSGKSNTGSVVAEELLERGHPLLIVDIDGEYYGLKEEYELLQVGATEQCDLQVGPEHAGKLAELALEKGVPIILDVSGYLDEDVADELVKEVARELFVREQDLRQPFVMLVEEIHEYIPQQGSPGEVGKMLIKIGKRGRKHGLGILGMSQRPADVKKDFITQCDLLVWHRLTWNNDTDVVARVIDREHADAIEDLNDGQAFVQADWSDTEVETVQFRRKHTFDAGATPGLDDVERPELKGIGEELVGELEEISDEHERRQDRITELEERLEEKDERIAELEEDLEAAEDLQRIGEAIIGAAKEDGSGSGAGEALDQELLEEKNAEIHELREQVEALQTERDELAAEVDELTDEVDRLSGYRDRVEQAEEIEERLREVEAWFASAPPALRDTAEAAEVMFQDAGDRDGELREQLDRKDERIQELEAKLADAGQPAVPTNYEDFLEDDVVKEQINDAKANSSASEKYIRATIAAILDAGGPVTYDDVQDMPDASNKTHVGRAVNALAERRVVSVDEDDGPKRVDLNPGGIEAIKQEAQRRDRRKEIMSNL